MEGLSIKLPAEVRRRLAEEARRRNVTQSAIVREIIERALADEHGHEPAPNCAALVRDLAGSVSSGHPDLATSKVLLEEAMSAAGGDGAERRR